MQEVYCGNQVKWRISLTLLHKKSGSRATLVKFREMLKRTAAANCLPDYQLSYDDKADQVLFYTKDPKKLVAIPVS
jgi:hypothetical protein